MSRVVDLNIDPDKWNTQTSNKIHGSRYEHAFEGYIKYEYYISSSNSLFKLASLEYNGHKLKFPSPTTLILKFYTYFTNNNILLAIQIRGGKNIYFTNPDTGKDINGDTKFDEFITTNNTPLNESTDIKEILDNVVKNKGLDYEGLSDDIKKKLWKANAITFDISQKPIKSKEKHVTYKSYITDVEVTVIDSGKIANTYPKVQHKASTPFYIRGLKDAGRKDVNIYNGFPNDPLDNFTVYYATSDSSYNDPLLVVVTTQDISSTDQRFIKSQYYISKNQGSTEWDIRRIEYPGIDDSELKEILTSIARHSKLYINKVNDSGDLQKKLTDITEGLIIDFSLATGDSGTYDSGNGKKVLYKRTKYDGYSSICHADTFTSFSIKDIKVTSDVSVSGVTLPTGTILSRLRVFYYGTDKTEYPLMVYFKYVSAGKKMWIRRYYGDTIWQESTDHSPTSDLDYPAIKKVIEQLNIPRITIDLSQTGEYIPTGNILKLKVDKSGVSGSGFYKFAQTAPRDLGFKIKGVTHKGNTLNGIKSNDHLDRITAYYEGQDPKNKENLLMIELLKKRGNSNMYVYYCREDKESGWIVIPRQTEKLDGIPLTSKLKELKEKLDAKKKKTKQAEGGDKGGTEPNGETGKGAGGVDKGDNKGQESAGGGSAGNEARNSDYVDAEAQPDAATLQSSSNSGAIAGGVLGAIVCIVLLALLIKKVGPSVRAHFETRNPPL
ncbi:hypothetical protein BEWA_049690 [Theileria equi strain WA]|uniref:Uncharacterized protein n=1 Tax=Theileria equi strain WA TaxID=1537102 RepID=L1LAK0_THEEQ|nr:hypothetical protein BEWA_049690 [Theileria equi strain WA]EKX72502.1 hypothetical protein BEWA_049690 [Theileria equi strain WA]|eukprot:XP_004831954.1 hypothetical protein BEWA_049690 [Theileria equi strain WA]